MYARTDLTKMIVTGERVRRDMEVRYIAGCKRGGLCYGVFVRGDSESWGTASSMREAKVLAREGAEFLISLGVTMIQITIRNRKGQIVGDITLPKNMDPKHSKG
jgi:hypothetical protein